jgi:hypothetical protein
MKKSKSYNEYGNRNNNIEWDFSVPLKSLTSVGIRLKVRKCGRGIIRIL